MSGALAPRTRWRRSAPWVVSLGVHALLFLLVFARASGDLIATENGGAAADGVNVVLIRAAQSPAAAAATDDGQLQLLLARHGSDQPPVFIPPEPTRDGLDSLMRRLLRTSPSPSSQTEAPTRATETFDRETVDGETAVAQAPRRGVGPGRPGTGRTGSTGSLWGVVAPCWRPSAQGGRVAVTLEVSLDATGRLSKPPTILRPPREQLNEPRLRAEALALSALQACLPRGDVRFAGQTYRLEFAPAS